MNPIKERRLWQDADQLLRMYFLVASVFIISSVPSQLCPTLCDPYSTPGLPVFIMKVPNCLPRSDLWLPGPLSRALLYVIKTVTQVCPAGCQV